MALDVRFGLYCRHCSQFTGKGDLLGIDEVHRCRVEPGTSMIECL